jgi:NADH:ubiquinone oxidoreductase subunit E
MKPPEIDWDKIHEIIEKHKGDRWGLIPLLQEVQEHTGYIPPEAIEPIAEAMNLFPSEVQGVITFYAGFSLKPKGKYVLRVCRGTACHVKGSRSVLRLMQKELDLKEGETSPDYQFTLETVACLGAWSWGNIKKNEALRLPQADLRPAEYASERENVQYGEAFIHRKAGVAPQ